MEQVKNIKALLDAAKPFLAALPDGHPMAWLVAAYVDAERVAAGDLVHNDAGYFQGVAQIAIIHGGELVEYYEELVSQCVDIEAPTVDSWDGCENAA